MYSLGEAGRALGFLTLGKKKLGALGFRGTRVNSAGMYALGHPGILRVQTFGLLSSFAGH